MAGGLEVELNPVVGGFSAAVAITHAGDGRIFVTEQDGLIRIVDGGAILPTPYLDLTLLMGSGFEGGLKGIAFHPGYPVTPFVFVHYSDTGDDTVIERYEVSALDPNQGDPLTAAGLLEIEQFTTQHRGGEPRFGPDGYLYIPLGDGGGQNDPQCRGQRLDTLLGKLLRIDVDQNVNTAPHYGIPNDNPFVGPGDPADEVWAIGFRNPWRISFDRGTGALFIADVGQNQREEVNRQPASSGGGENYGWKVMEGTFCHDPDPIDPDCPLSTASCFDPSYTPPTIEYNHDLGDCSITGGFVYRGSQIPDLVGRYLYGDFCTGNLWAATDVGGGTWTSELLPVSLNGVQAFGEDVDGEIYLTEGSTLYRLEAAAIFADGFESGNVTAWSAAQP